jgi:hypothetical protein
MPAAGEWTDDDLLMALNSADAEFSLSAARHLRTYPPWKIVRLVQSASGFQVPAYHRVGRSGLLLLIAVILIAINAGGFSPGVGIAASAAGCGFMLYTAIVISFFPGRDMSNCFNCLAMHIGALSTSDALPTVISLVTADNSSVAPLAIRRAAYSAARKILPSLSDEEFENLDPEIRAALVRMLSNPYDDPELSAIIIETLAHTSDPFELGLRSLLTGLACQSAPTSNMKCVRSAAHLALDRLAERRSQHFIARSLLRASERPDPPADLLRPITAVTREPAELVRPAEADHQSIEVPGST